MKRFFGMLFVSLMAVLFMYIQTLLLKNPSMYLYLSEALCVQWGLKNADSVRVVCQWVMYIVTAAPLLWVYFFSVLMARKSGWKITNLLLSIISMLVVSAVSFMTNSNIYYQFFSKFAYWQIDTSKSRLSVFYFTLGLCILCLIVIFGYMYAPSIKKNEKRYFEVTVLFKSIGRYAACFVIGHCILLFMISARSFLIGYRIIEVADYIHTMEPYTDSLLGVLLILVAEPLVHELAFRGLIFTHLKKTIPSAIAALASAVLYGIWYEMLYARSGMLIGAIFFGFVSCFICEKGGRLRYSIFAHAYMNLISLVVLGYMNQSRIPFLPKIYYGNKMLVTLARNNSPIMLLLTLFITIIGVGALKLFSTD